MQDRVPLYPGRVSLTPVSGNIYDMTMADQPQVVGTPLNKANLLSDAAVVAVWPNAADRPSDPVPSEAFIALGEKARILLDLVTTEVIGEGTRRDPLMVTLNDNIENYQFLEIWGYTTSTATSQGNLNIDVGESMDSTKRLLLLRIKAALTLYAKVFLMVNTAADGHVILSISMNTATGNPIGSDSFLTGAARLTGNKLMLSSSSSQSAVNAGLHIVIIGYKF